MTGGSSQQNDVSPDTRTLYAWLSRDADGIEGIIAAPVGRGIMPLVATDLRRARLLQAFAERSASERQFPAVLAKFERVEDMETIDPLAKTVHDDISTKKPT